MKNEYVIKGKETVIEINDKKVTIDTEDLEKINKYNGSWFILKNKEGKDYDYAAVCTKNENGKYELVLMHRAIMNAQKGKVIDHIDHNGLNNKKENLRECKHGENLQNRKGPQKNSKSGIRGVYWNKSNKTWIAQIRLNGKKVWEKSFQDKNIAGQEVEKARKIYHTHSA